jgi:hypothetical protein
MPKDYQEIERIVEEIKDYDENVGWVCWPDDVKKALTTYSNARALEAVEKVEKGVPEKIPEFVAVSPEDALNIEGYNKCRQATLDHIAKVKSELK